MKSFLEALKKDYKLLISYLVTLLNYYCFIIFLYNKFQNSKFLLSPYSLLLFLAVSVILCIGYVLIYFKNEKTILKNDFNQLDKVENIINNYFELQKGNLINQNIYSIDYIKKKEKNCSKNAEIWIVTGDLEEDVNNNEIFSIIGTNLKKGVTYRYFISKVAGEISPIAKNGRNKLENKYRKYLNKKLFFYEIDSELIIPDIDITIYNATNLDSDKRDGYVCVEIGDNDKSYSYQKISNKSLIVICDKLSNCFARKKERRIKKTNYSSKKYKNKTNSLVLIVYNALFVVMLATLNFTKIYSITSALSSLIPSLITIIITYIIIVSIDSLFSMYKDEQVNFKKKQANYEKVLLHNDITNTLEKVIENFQKNIFNTMNIGFEKDILNISKDCNTIWILTDLSRDIASIQFMNWLKSTMDSNCNIQIKILLPDSAKIKGRRALLEQLDEKYKSRIKLCTINENTHYLWANSYGIIYFETTGLNNTLYISLGADGNVVFKKIDRILLDIIEINDILGILEEMIS